MRRPWRRLGAPLAALLLARQGGVAAVQGVQGRFTSQLEPTRRADLTKEVVGESRLVALRPHRPEDVQPEDAALLQLFMELSRNGSRPSSSASPAASAAVAGANGTAPLARRLSPTAVAWDLSALEELLRSAALYDQVRALEQQSAQSASALREIAAVSANRTGRLMEAMAGQSARLVAELRALEQQGGGGQAARWRLPHEHVAARRPAPHGASLAKLARAVQDGELWSRPGGPAGGLVVEQPGGVEVAVPGDEILGTLRLAAVLAGTVIVAAMALLTTNRKSLSMAVYRKSGPRWDNSVAVASQHLAAHSHGPTDGKALGVWDTTVATFSCIIGTGLLAMPYAFSLAGMIAAPVTVFFVACSAYTAYLLSRSLNSLGHFSLGLLVESAFGRKAKGAINTFLIVELWGYVLSTLVCLAMNVAQVLEGLDMSVAVGLSAFAVYGLSFVPARLLTRVSVVSNMVFIACCCLFILTGLLLPKKAPSSDIHFVKPYGLFSAAGILVFSPAGHSFYPSLMERMEEPKKFPECLAKAYAAASVVYLSVAVAGYYLFGNAAQPSAVRNIGSDLNLVPLEGLYWMSPLAALGMVIKLLALTTLCLTTFTNTVKGVVAGHLKASPQTVEALATPGALIVTAVVAMHFAHEMAILLNLLGSVFCMNIAFVVPVLCHWKLSTDSIGCLRRLGFIGLVFMGGSLAVLGLLTSL